MSSSARSAVAVALLLLGGCATVPGNPDNLCAIFTEKPGWYRAAAKARKQWGTPISVAMAFTRRESSYVHDARPPRTTILWVIPWRRPSSAYGYAQATNAAWSDYQRSTGDYGADRDDFADAMDFIGWYNQVSRDRLGLASTDAYRLYVAYHEGHSGYASGAWRSDGQVKAYARKVERRAARYREQLLGCEGELKRRRCWLCFWRW